jgi:hypothetical protein
MRIVYKFFITVTLLFPWNVNPVPAVQVVSEALTRIVRGLAVVWNILEPNDVNDVRVV